MDKPGNYTGRLIVNDGTVNSAPDIVVISTVNSAPVAHAGPDLTYFVGDTAQLDGSGSSDVDGDPLTYQWALTAVPPGSTAALSDPTVVAPIFILDRPGTYVVQLLVNDGRVSSAPDTVTISTANSKPIAHAGPDQSTLVGTRVYLDGSGSSDVDGDPLIYQWSVTARPTGSTATLDNPTTIAPSFLVDKPGIYTVQLIVNDRTLNSTPTTVSISTINARPMANAGPDQEVHVGETVQLDGSGSTDADGDPLLYQWSLASLPADSTAALSSIDTVQTTFEPDVAGTYVVQLIVNDGMVDSVPDTTTVTVTVLDTDPPSAPDLSRITVGPMTNEQVTITGAVGSVEGNGRVRVTNVRTGQMVTATALTNGSFTVRIAAQEWDTLWVVVADSAGNASPVVTAQVEGSEGTLSVTVIEPSAGAAVSSNRILVRGTVQGPPNTGVTVNGLVATVQAGRFIASQVPLTQGSNTLTVTATTLTGHSATTSMTVTSAGLSPVLELAATPASGIVSPSYPLYVTFTYEFHAATVTQSLSVDFDGDGTNDIVDADPTAVFLGFSYTNPGIYLVHLSLTDQQGQVFHAETPVVVQDAVPADAMFKGIWNGMNDALLAGDTVTALTFLTSRARQVYGPVFDVLLPHMTDVVATFTSFRGVKVSPGYAEYALNRVINGENRLFLIYFLKDTDGVWRLEAM